jgi:hypothetical protein
MAVEQKDAAALQDAAVLREAQRKAASDSASFFSSASMSSEEAQEEASLAMTTKESDLLNVFENQQFLHENKLKFTLNEEGGGTLTPADTKEG